MPSKIRTHGFQYVCTHLTLGVCPCTEGQTHRSASSTGRKACYEAPTNGRKGTHAKKQEETKEGTLMLYDDHWKIKKVLRDSDLGNLSRLLLAKDLAESFVMPVLSDAAKVEANGKGTQLVIWDVDTSSMHYLTFKLWISSRSYIFGGNWTRDFVKRRGLKKGDEIGFHWDPLKNCFDFSVLRRA